MSSYPECIRCKEEIEDQPEEFVGHCDKCYRMFLSAPDDVYYAEQPAPDKMHE